MFRSIRFRHKANAVCRNLSRFALSPLDFEPACAGLQNRKVKMFSLLLPSHNLHQMSQCSVFKVHLELSLIEIFFSEDFNQPSSQKNGGPKWTRTTDLTIISRVL